MACFGIFSRRPEHPCRWGAKRTPLVKGLLRDMQIARLAPFEVNEKMRGRCVATKAFRPRRSSALGGPPGDAAPIIWEAWFEDSWICCCCYASSFASLDFPASVTRLTGLDYSGEKILTADLDPCGSPTGSSTWIWSVTVQKKLKDQPEIDSAIAMKFVAIS